MHFLVSDVCKPLAAVSAIVDQGNRVRLGRTGGFIENEKTGKRIELKRKRGTFVMTMDVDADEDFGRRA